MSYQVAYEQGKLEGIKEVVNIINPKLLLMFGRYPDWWEAKLKKWGIK